MNRTRLVFEKDKEWENRMEKVIEREKVRERDREVDKYQEEEDIRLWSCFGPPSHSLSNRLILKEIAQKHARILSFFSLQEMQNVSSGRA